MDDKTAIASADRAAIVYVSDLAYEQFDPADLFDLAFLLRSGSHELVAVCLAETAAERGERIVDSLSARAVVAKPLVLLGADALAAFLNNVARPVSLIVVGGYSLVAQALWANKPLFRQAVARIFVVGGHANDYGPGYPPQKRRVPADPRLEQQNPERFTPEGDLRLGRNEERRAWGTLLASGEAVIWLPRDICLWRYAAPQLLEGGGPLSEFLCRELFFSQLLVHGLGDRYASAARPVLLSALPGLLLSVKPDPFVWMRLFRAVALRIEVDNGRILSLATNDSTPNLYAVVAIDGQALGKLLTKPLRDQPLSEV